MLVTGTGRCGTVFMARLLTSLGVMCGHEAVFDLAGPEGARQRLDTESIKTSYVSTVNALRNEELAGWFDPATVRAESSYMAAPFIDGELLRNVPVLHVVRQPMQVISSFCKDIGFFRDGDSLFAPYRDFVLAHIGSDVMTLPTEIERTALFWMRWNRMIEDKAADRPYLRVKVEGAPDDALLDFLKVAPAAREQAWADTTTNSWKRRDGDLRIDDLPAGRLRDDVTALAERYGYALAPAG